MTIKQIHDIATGHIIEQELSPEELAEAEARRTAAEAAAAIRAAIETERDAARDDVVATKADQLLAQITAGLAANASDQTDLEAAATLAAVRPIVARMLQREAGMMNGLQAIVRYLKVSAQ